MLFGVGPGDPKALVKELLEASLPRLEKDLRKMQKEAPSQASPSSRPSAHVVVLAHANHYVFRSNEADVLREMNSFLAGLQ